MPVEISPFGHSNGEFPNVDPKSGTTLFWIVNNQGLGTSVTKTGAGNFDICSDNDANVNALITPSNKHYDMFCA